MTHLRDLLGSSLLPRASSHRGGRALSSVFKETIGRSGGRAYPAAFITVPRVGEREEWGRLGSACSREWGPEAWHLFAWALEVQPPLPSYPRLIKGDGEVLEEIVTKERHREINKVGVTPFPGVHAQFCF